MKLEWQSMKSCYEAWLPLDFLPPGSGFVYRNSNNMSPLDTLPSIIRLSSGHAEAQSQDVIVVGNENTNEYVLAGAVTAFRSLTYFQVHKDVRITGIHVRQPDIKPGETPEKVIVLQGNDWRKLLLEYAKITAKEMGVKPAIAPGITIMRTSPKLIFWKMWTS